MFCSLVYPHHLKQSITQRQIEASQKDPYPLGRCEEAGKEEERD